MKVKFEKSSEMFFFFQDYWNFVQGFWGVEESEEYWELFVAELNRLAKKYPSEFQKSLLFCVLDEQEKKYEERRNGHGKIKSV